MFRNKSQSSTEQKLQAIPSTSYSSHESVISTEADKATFVRQPLQSLVLPELGICSETKLYFHSEGQTEYDFQEKSILCHSGSLVRFNSYFNAFSLERWNNLAGVEAPALHVRIRGAFRVRLYTQSIANGVTLHAETTIQSSVATSFDLFESYSSPRPEGMLFVEFQSQQDQSTIESGYFWSKTPAKRKVHLGLVICTFKREEYVKKNLHILSKHLLNDAEYSESISILVVDNAQSLPPANHKKVKIIPNINAGGAGGFTRGLIEIQNKEQEYTHVAFCDDDVLFEPEAFKRIISFFRLATDPDVCIGGAMLRLDKKNIQHENGAVWNFRRLIPLKYRLDLNNPDSVVYNTVSESSSSHGWWLFGFSLSMLNKHSIGLPLPYFFRWDDVEFSLRLRARNIKTTDINGICVWHEPFERKYSSVTDYYITRNEFVTRVLHDPDFNLMAALLLVVKRCAARALGYKYETAGYVLDGFTDALRGPEFFKKTDPTILHSKLLSEQTEINKPFAPDSVPAYKYPGDDFHTDSNLARLLRPITLYGHILPKFLFKKSKSIHDSGFAVSPLHGQSLWKDFRCPEIMYLDKDSRTGFIAKHSKHAFFMILFRLLGVCLITSMRFQSVRRDYIKALPELKSQEFWNEYLKLEKNK